MATVRAVVVRWIADEPQPGWAEVVLTDAQGNRHSIFDKPPIFDAANMLRPDSSYPVELYLACEVDSVTTDEAMVRLSHGIASMTGQSQFVVPRHSLRGA